MSLPLTRMLLIHRNIITDLVLFCLFQKPSNKADKEDKRQVRCRVPKCTLTYIPEEENAHWLAYHENKHLALICECGFSSISVVSFTMHLRVQHSLKLRYTECVIGFLWRVPAFKTFYQCSKNVKTDAGKLQRCFFQSTYKQVLDSHDCKRESTPYAIEIMAEPLFFDAIAKIHKPERGLPLQRNEKFRPPGFPDQKFVHEHPYNAEDEYNFAHVCNLIKDQNEEQKLVPKRRPKTPERTTTRDRSYSRVAKTPPPSRRVPQVTVPLKSSMKTFPLKRKTQPEKTEKQRLTQYEYQLHEADSLRKTRNNDLSPSKRRNLSPFHDPYVMDSNQLTDYAARLYQRQKDGVISINEMFNVATTQPAGAAIEQTPKRPVMPTDAWSTYDSRLTKLEQELLYQDHKRKFEEMCKPPTFRRELSPFPDLRSMDNSRVEQLKGKLERRHRSGLITPRPEKCPPESQTKPEETLTPQQEDELLGSPSRDRSKSPAKPETGGEQTDMEVETERGRSRKKRNRKKRPRADSQAGQPKPYGRPSTDDQQRSKRSKPGSRPHTPSRVQFQSSSQEPNEMALRSDLLTKISIPAIGNEITSPLLDCQVIEKTPRDAVFTGTFIMSNQIAVPQQYSVHVMGNVDVGTYALCRNDGVPCAMVSITFTVSHPLGYTKPMWRQFNPFNYPMYAWLVNLDCKPAQVWFTLCMSKLVFPGRYRLQQLPHTRCVLGTEVLITENNLNFGNQQYIRYK